MLSNALWRAQTALHGSDNSFALPVLLVTGASLIVVYKHYFEEGASSNTDKHFLALVVIQMVPLVLLQMRMMSCPDPVSMLSRFGTKTLLMHLCFLTLRICAWPIIEVGIGFCNIVGLLTSCAALHWGFGVGPSSILKHLDIVGLWMVAFVAAVFTAFLGFHSGGKISETIICSTSNYIEILAFVPAVWMVQRAIKKSDDTYAGSDEIVQNQSLFFFSFLVSYYVMEDVITAISLFKVAPSICLGHTIHFLLLLDFACFLMAKIYNPDKVQGSFLRRIPDQFFV